MHVTAVVIPTYNRRETLLLALKAVFEALPPAHRVLVVDSGSSDGTRESVRARYPQVDLIEGDASMWWAAAVNRGVQRAKELGCTYVLTYNDDNVATPGLFSALGEAAAADSGCIIGAACCYLDRPEIAFFSGRMQARGSDRFYYLDRDAPLAEIGDRSGPVDMLHGMCTLFPMAVFDTVGLFDEKAFPQVFADDDLLMRAKAAGFTLRVCTRAVVLNDRSKTGVNPYDRRLGPRGCVRLLTSRNSTFQVVARTRFLWRHRTSTFRFCKTWLLDYLRLLALVTCRWLLPQRAFYRIGIGWTRRLQRL
ncbi:MAG TPA: glycosyltransferase family 2 protein [candidate division Zixibacteria bacterium]|nr:glycosyltransferase family 2 protein [candidate division Zixibacteria bacterium]